MTIDDAFDRLGKSDFRSKFHLADDDIKYIDEKGMKKIEEHCRDFVKKKLAPAYPQNDGRQTPWNGHPVFVAQHACACCCRGCLNKWYKVEKGTELSEVQQQKIVNLLMEWIRREYEQKKR